MSRLTFIAEAQATIIVTIAYVILFVVTFGALMPIQAQFFDWLPMSISLLFLPHGVRVLAVYLYGCEPPPLNWSVPIVRKTENRRWELRDRSLKRLLLS